MEAIQIISKIQQSKSVVEIFPDFKTWRNEYRDFSKIIHPDICKESGSTDAFAKLNTYKDEIENGKKYRDDAGEYTTNGFWIEFKSSEKNLVWSIENYRLFKQLKGQANEHFKKYIPAEGKLLADGTFRFEFDKRAIPLSGLTLPQEHVNWVLNRLLEYCSYLSEIGFSHCGLNPESVFIIPETHGIQICSFYHLTKFGNKIKTISGKYKNWYPQEMFNTKIAASIIDIELSKKIALYLFGERYGNAVKLRKTHNEDFINFIISQNDNAFKTLSLYRELLKKNFKKQFHILNI